MCIRRRVPACCISYVYISCLIPGIAAFSVSRRCLLGEIVCDTCSLLRGLDTLAGFFTIFYNGDNVCVFLFASLHTRSLLKS